MQKRFFVLYLFSQYGFKLFLSFFIETLACHLPWTMPIALITAANGIYLPTLAALIIGQQCRRSIYPDRDLSAFNRRLFRTNHSLTALEQ